MIVFSSKTKRFLHKVHRCGVLDNHCRPALSGVVPGYNFNLVIMRYRSTVDYLLLAGGVFICSMGVLLA